MKGFEKLLDTVRKNNPDLISEQAAQEMLSDYQSYETQLQDDAFAKGKSAGFEEGYREGMEKQKAVCQQEMDELLAKCDEDATNKLESIVRTLNEDHTAKLQEIYDLCCQNMVPVSEVEAMDADHADKFAQAMEAIDDEHAKKLDEVYKTAKDSAEAACKKIKETAEAEKEEIVKESADKIDALTKQLETEKERKIELLSESVEKYINYALQSAIPTKSLISEAKYNASQKALDKITSILKINNLIQESKDGVFQDYESKIKAAQEKQNELMVENANLKDTLNKKEAAILLESKLTKCTPAEAAFLRSYFKNAKSSTIIEEQIEDAREAYQRMHAEKRAQAMKTVEAAKNATATPSKLVSESKKPVKKEEPKKVVTESIKETVKEKHVPANTAMNPFVAAYAEMLKNN